MCILHQIFNIWYQNALFFLIFVMMQLWRSGAEQKE